MAITPAIIQAIALLVIESWPFSQPLARDCFRLIDSFERIIGAAWSTTHYDLQVESIEDRILIAFCGTSTSNDFMDNTWHQQAFHLADPDVGKHISNWFRKIVRFIPA